MRLNPRATGAPRNPGKGNLWLTGEGGQPLMLPVDAVIGWPDASSDGRYVVYAVNQNGYINVWRIDRDGSNPLQLTSGNYDFQPRCSADGKWIAYSSQYTPPWNLVVIPFEGMPPVKVFENRGGPVQWSADSQALTWVMTSGGVSNLWGQPLAGGPPRQITNFSADQIADFAWSPDGRKLAFRRRVTSSDIVLINNVR
jgi:Tol biopolymer transport system component